MPAPGSDRASQLLESRFPTSAATATRDIGAPRSRVRAADVEQTMTRTLDRVADLPGVASVTNPYHDAELAPDQRERRHRVRHRQLRGRLQDIDPGARRGPWSTPPRRPRATDSHRTGQQAVALTESAAATSPRPSAWPWPRWSCSSPSAPSPRRCCPVAARAGLVGTAYAAVALLGHAMTVADFRARAASSGLGVGIDYALFIVTRRRRENGGCRWPRPPPTSGDHRASRRLRGCHRVASPCWHMLRLSFLNGVAADRDPHRRPP
ncbi:MMPL family transporter [Streptomyces violaceorubidus]